MLMFFGFFFFVFFVVIFFFFTTNYFCTSVKLVASICTSNLLLADVSKKCWMSDKLTASVDPGQMLQNALFVHTCMCQYFG